MLRRFPLFVLFLVLFLSSGLSYSQVEGISVYDVLSHPLDGVSYTDAVDLTGYKTYLIQVDFNEPGQQLVSIFGTNEPGDDGNPRPLFITYEEDCYDHSIFGTDVGMTFTPETAKLFFQDACFDTFLTLGFIPKCNEPYGTENYFDYVFSVSEPAALASNTCDIFIAEGILAAIPPSVFQIYNGEYPIFILQITTNGKFSFCTNVQYRPNSNLNVTIDDYFCLTDVLAGCLNPEFPNYNPEANVSDGSCPDPIGCTDPNATNYNPLAVDDDGMCLYSDCTDPEACNFNELAQDDDGSCVYPGCNDVLACNYEVDAACDDGSCLYPGCQDEEACNFNALAGCDDGSCAYPGCINLLACNFNEEAGCDDGSCSFPGCTDALACNYEAEAGCPNESCVYPGCTDATACNFNSLAGCDDGNCTYPGCNDPQACNYLKSAGCPDGSCVYPGCTDQLACNYSEEAGCDDDSCTYPGCTDSSACNYEADAACEDDSCTYPGCLDTTACNYNELAGCEDNSICEYLIAGEIEGPAIVSDGVFYSYTYISDTSGELEWFVVNGGIVGGQGTSEVSILWYETGAGELSVVETSQRDCSATAVFNVEINVSISELNDEIITIYPNPSNGVVTLEIPTDWIGSSLDLFTEAGRLIRSESNLVQSIVTIDLSDLPKGIYVFVIRNKGATAHRKITLR